MNPMDEGCRLCLDHFAECFTTIDNPLLKDQMEKVFSFSIEPKQGYCSGVCQSCSYAISEFYQYSEKVRQNQEVLSGRATNCDPTADSNHVNDSGLPETTADGEEEAPPLELEIVKIEKLSDSGLPEGTENACEPKDGVSGEDETTDSSEDELYKTPSKKSPTKRKFTNRETGKYKKTPKQERKEEDKLFNKYFRMNCDLCGTSAATFTELLSHFWKEHNTRFGYIMCCNKKLSKRYLIRDHIDFHTKPDAFRCEMCGMNCKNKYSLNNHIINKHSNAQEEVPFSDTQTTLEIAKVETLGDSGLLESKDDACGPKDEVLGEEETPILELERVKIEKFSDSGLPETTEIACEPKDGVSGEEESANSGYDELYKTPSKKSSTKRKFDNLEAGEYWMTSKQKRIAEDQLFNKYFRMVCDLCGTSAATFTELLSHFWKVHKTRYGYIVCCNKKLFKRYTIRDHIDFHTNPDAFRCELCGINYMNKDTLNSHMICKHSTAEEEVSLSDLKITLEIAKVETRGNSGLLETNDDACGPNDDAPEEDEAPTVDSKITLESVKIETMSDSGYPETTENACEPKDEVSGEEVCSSDDDESYEPPPKKSQPKRRGRPRKQDLAELKAGESTRKSKQIIQKKYQKRNEEDQLFNQHFRMVCDLCGTSAATFTKLLSHFWKEHNTRYGYIVCCNKKLFKRYTIRDHIDFHTKPDAFRCEMCGSNYMNKDTLNNHMLSKHSSGGPFKCDLCPESFRQKAALVNHMKRHEKVECPKCSKMFASRRYLTIHMMNKHSGKIVCTTCGEDFLSQQAFYQHMSQHMENEAQRVQCGICQLWLKNEKSLRNHTTLEHTEGDQEVQCDVGMDGAR